MLYHRFMDASVIVQLMEQSLRNDLQLAAVANGWQFRAWGHKDLPAGQLLLNSATQNGSLRDEVAQHKARVNKLEVRLSQREKAAAHTLRKVLCAVLFMCCRALCCCVLLLYCMLCCVVWCGLVWCGVVWCGVVWCGVAWRGVAWCGVVWCGVVWCGVVWCGVVWCGVVWCGVVWCAEGAITKRQWPGCVARGWALNRKP